MSNYAKLYWLTRLDSIQGLCFFLLIITPIILIGYHTFRYDCCYDEDDELKFGKKFGRIKNIAWALFFSASLVMTFIPSKNEAILIMAGGKTMDFVQQDTSISKIPSQTTLIISQYLDKTIEDLNKAK